MDFKEFIKPELLILVPVLWFIGIVIKAMPKVSNWLIPFILMALGIILTTSYILGTDLPIVGRMIGNFIFSAVTQGVLVAAGAVMVDQVIKQVNVAKLGG